MKIAIYTGTFLRNKDGVAKTLFELVKTTKEQGHEIAIWSPEVTPLEGVTTTEMASIPVPMYSDYRFSIFKKELYSQLNQFAPDIIQISTPDMVALKVVKYSRKRSIPVVSIFHTNFPSYLEYYRLHLFKKPFWKRLIKLYNKCDMVYAPTNEMKRQLLDKGVKRVSIWSRGIHRNLFNPRRRSDEIRAKWGVSNEHVLLYAGRFVWFKGLKILQEIYNKFKEEGEKKIKFVLIGSGPIESELKDTMKDAVFPGYLSGDELYNSYASGDIFIFPSPTETFGNVVQEAISSGLPTVVSDKGGCREIVEQSGAGIICKSDDSDEFHNACRKLLHDRTYFLKLRKKGLEWANTRTWDKINGQLLTDYQRIINAKKN